MVDIKFTEGELNFAVPTAGKSCKTWYKIYGDLTPTNPQHTTPLVILHGGPGIPHDYLVPIAKSLVSETGLPVVLYDQIGCGRSTHLPEKKGDGSFLTLALFIEELENLLSQLNIQEGFDLLGQSWGGMVAATYATRRPNGLRRLILSNPLADMKQWENSLYRLRREFPEEVQAVLTRHEKAATMDSEEYLQAIGLFYERHLCRIKPVPEELERAIAGSMEDTTVSHTMYETNRGPIEAQYVEI